MSDRKVGYGNPPEHSRFKKGVSANPKGRPKRQLPEVAEVISAVMDAAVEYRESGRAQKASRWELSIRRHLKRALEGDIGAAEALLRLRAQAQEKRNTASQVVHINDLLPTVVSQAGEQHIEELPSPGHAEMPVQRKPSDADPTGEDP
jgi:hypothetical protein